MGLNEEGDARGWGGGDGGDHCEVDADVLDAEFDAGEEEAEAREGWWRCGGG